MLDPAEEEPSLGWTASTKQEGSQWLGGLDDSEQEHDGREPDPDGEANGDDEPSLGSVEVGVDHTRLDWKGNPYSEEVGVNQSMWGSSGTDDLEGDQADREPSLGAPEDHPVYWGHGDQTHWGRGGLDDREDDGDDREPDFDNEPECGI